MNPFTTGHRRIFLSFYAESRVDSESLFFFCEEITMGLAYILRRVDAIFEVFCASFDSNSNLRMSAKK
jgi:hypothetical protein